ncbi:hypothetical protein [Lewinella sp. W8]|uniref:hypothetical protein n=1 Tax=Lewinella sp. W8 TaxID=2528208 RepID=UPI0010677B0C|nr:hypothetical protein [Lewinella sp. W8]MTB50062.1 hypothetical protein [Lewinella sp. W8]
MKPRFSLKDFRQLAEQLQTEPDVPRLLDNLALTKEELDLLYLFTDNYREEIWGHGMCYETEEALPHVHSASAVLAQVYEYKEGHKYSEREYYNTWTYGHYAMWYKYFPDDFSGMTIGEAGRKLAKEYGHDEKWVANFRKRVPKYSTPSQRQKHSKIIYQIHWRVISQGIEIPTALKNDLHALWKKHKRKRTVR